MYDLILFGLAILINKCNLIYDICSHRHGIKQPRNPWSDGPKYITQCPIEPGSNFTYEVILSTEEGTLWWHAYSDWTRSSVHGTIVIYPIEGTTYPYPKPDDEEIFVLGTYIKFYESFIYEIKH
jgi:laccase